MIEPQRSPGVGLEPECRRQNTESILILVERKASEITRLMPVPKSSIVNAHAKRRRKRVQRCKTWLLFSRQQGLGDFQL